VSQVDPWFVHLSSPAKLAAFASRGAWRPARHLMLLNRYLLDLAGRSVTHLVVTVPPRHGKSTIISKYFAAWYLGTFPEHNVLVTSYGADFAASWAEQAKAVLKEHGHLFGPASQLTFKARRGYNFSLAGGGNMFTSGVGGQITGKGAHIIVIDDPVKNDEEADSPVYREKTDNWFRGTVYTRQEPGCVFCIIMTRWHEDDLVGRLLRDAEGGGQKWTVLNLPAIAEQDEPPFPYGMGRQRGEALWPERYPIDKLREIEIVEGPRHWNALYQQRPAPEGGGIFQRNWFTVSLTAPPCVRAVRYWDLAATSALTSRDPDYTVGVLMGVDKNGMYWVLDVCRFRGDPGQVESTIQRVAAEDARLPVSVVGSPVRTWIEQEPGAGAKIAVRNLIVNVLAGYPVFADPAGTMSTTSLGRHNKIQRADPLSGQAKAGNVKLLTADWNKAFLDELCSFPNGTHDDIVDSSSGAFNMLAMTRAGAAAISGERDPAVTNFQQPGIEPKGRMRDFQV